MGAIFEAECLNRHPYSRCTSSLADRGMASDREGMSGVLGTVAKDVISVENH
jgi:hypothetical protein